MAHLFPSILMFGGPGTGKGTQGTILGQLPNLCHLAMGDIFRSLNPNSELGREFASWSTRGLLVPDEFTVRLFREHVKARVERGDIIPDYHVLLLDGIPRTVAQVDLLEHVVEIRKVIHLEVADRETLVSRLSARARKANRPDDADPDVIRTRLSVYDEETCPVLEALPADRIVHINGMQHPLAVLRDIAASLVDVVPSL